MLDKNKEVNKSLPCISLIGMPGSGKSTIGEKLAKKIAWAYMDTDFLLESLYACKLQDIVDNLSHNAFLDAEEQMILTIRSGRNIIATGGSVIYRPEAMNHLKTLGPVVYIECGVKCLKDRIALNPQRGIAIKDGQSLDDLFLERKKLYEKYADFACNSEIMPPDDCANYIMEKVSRITEKNKNYFHD